MLSQTELTLLLGDASQAIADIDVMTPLTYGQDASGAFYRLDCTLMDYFVLSNWVQYADGTTGTLTNYITQADFDVLVSKVKAYATGY